MSILRLYSGTAKPQFFWDDAAMCLGEQLQTWLYPGDRRNTDWNYFNNDTSSYPGRQIFKFDVHVTVHRDKFLYNKLTRCINFSNLFLE